MSAAFRAIIYVGIGLPAAVVLVPAMIDDLSPGPLLVPGFALVAVGLVIYLWTVWDFAMAGRGTPVPLDPPRVLVARGLYRAVRNPMAIGFLMILVGEAVAVASSAILGYAAVWLVAIHLFVVFVEEPGLERRFGEPYIAYCRSVRRWLPRVAGLRPRA